MSGIILLILRLLIALCLFAFLGWALLTLWRELKEYQKILSTHKPPSISLSRQTNNVPERFSYNITEVIIGRDPTCELFLEDRAISARHAKLSHHHKQWWVEDLKSTNGTFLNQETVEEPMVITNGDKLRCGGVELTIHIGENYHE